MTTATLAVNTVNPSINLAALNVPATVVVSNTTPAVQASSVEQLKSLETAHILSLIHI